eukprot:3715291-Rhodomonas_salina.1
MSARSKKLGSERKLSYSTAARKPLLAMAEKSASDCARIAWTAASRKVSTESCSESERRDRKNPCCPRSHAQSGGRE